MKKKKEKNEMPTARRMPISESTYQPSRPELREEMDMPKASEKMIRGAFMQPFKFVKE